MKNKIYLSEKLNSKELLTKILYEEYNIFNYDLIYNEYGKPYLKDQQLYFNISNCDNITVLIISDYEIGIDIEHIIYNDRVINKTFNEKEISLLNKSINKEELFTKMWTLKEAYVKYLGIGLSYGLKNVDTFKLKKHIIKYKNYYISYQNEKASI